MFTQDSVIMPALVALKACLCDTLDDRRLGNNCQCVIVHGSGASVQPPAVGRGFAWVGVNTIFPSKTFPQPDSSATSCAAPLAATITMGVIRCYQINPNGESEENLYEYMDKQMADMAAVRHALQCCSGDDYDVVLGQYTPAELEGGTYGGFWTATVAPA